MICEGEWAALMSNKERLEAEVATLKRRMDKAGAIIADCAVFGFAGNDLARVLALLDTEAATTAQGGS